mmetsp:Transcript_26601/g.80647  ORF Transcript_26601/g.80647 Transcript_26601/m.80647 type:complete len:292 (+) Transcript_26601:70-945(+)|eukprot:scaffold153720_cov31-Tisochrysis_lutea.AAC.3
MLRTKPCVFPMRQTLASVRSNSAVARACSCCATSPRSSRDAMTSSASISPRRVLTLACSCSCERLSNATSAPSSPRHEASRASARRIKLRASLSSDAMSIRAVAVPGRVSSRRRAARESFPNASLPIAASEKMASAAAGRSGASPLRRRSRTCAMSPRATSTMCIPARATGDSGLLETLQSSSLSTATSRRCTTNRASSAIADTVLLRMSSPGDPFDERAREITEWSRCSSYFSTSRVKRFASRNASSTRADLGASAWLHKVNKAELCRISSAFVRSAATSMTRFAAALCL